MRYESSLEEIRIEKWKDYEFTEEIKYRWKSCLQRSKNSSCITIQAILLFCQWFHKKSICAILTKNKMKNV